MIVNNVNNVNKTHIGQHKNTKNNRNSTFTTYNTSTPLSKIFLPSFNNTTHSTSLKNIKIETQHRTEKKNEPENSNTIINLSNTFKLKNSDKTLLEKGFTFVPTPSINNRHNNIKIALHELFYRMSTIYYFRNQTQYKNNLHRKSNWKQPKPDNKNLINYFTRTEQNVINFIKNTEIAEAIPNISQKETNTLKTIKNNKNIIIKKADKGGAVVVMDKQDYIDKIEKHLKDEISYEKVKDNKYVLKDLETNIISFLETILYHHHINENTYKYLIPPEKPRTNLFYILPKVHKQEVPGRPIVSSVNSVTENISEFLTKCIQPLTSKLKSNISDTKSFLKSIITKKPPVGEIYLVSLDVVSLYTNIPHEEGINACIYFIEKHRHELPKFVPNKTILMTLFKFVLENNYFLFDNILYKQLFGTAMGTKMAPPYANLFLGKLEEEHINNDRFKNNINFYKRFLDDIFLVWKGTLAELSLFLNQINDIHPTIKFTCQYSSNEMNFLDTTIYIDIPKKRFMSKLYTKPTDTGTLLHYNSHHPKHTFNNIIYSQTIRYRMLTTNNKILRGQLNKLKNILISRGYPNKLINLNFKKIKHVTQKDCLYDKPKTPNRNLFNLKRKRSHYKSKNIYKSKIITTKNSENGATLPFIIPFYNNIDQLKNILHKNWNFIEMDIDLKDIMPNKPFIVYKRHKNLKDLLVRTRFSTEITKELKS